VGQERAVAAEVPVWRGSSFYLKKRVPKRYAAIEPRAAVWISLHTDSETVARTKAPIAWQHLVDGWEARLAGNSDDAEERFAAARSLAAARGFRYMTADQVAKLPKEERLARIEAIPVLGDKPDRPTAAAMLGGVGEPAITVTRALELFWSLAADRALGKSEDQLRRWKNPRKKAIANFVDVIGDKPIGDITIHDMLDFRQWWLDKITTDGLTPNSANKDLVHLADTLKTVNRMKRLQLVLPLSDLAIKEGQPRIRPPFSVKWIKSKLLHPDALRGLNKEARCILLGMINTGFRPSEGAGLLPHHIRLDVEVPHIAIEPEGRQLKNNNSRRVIPLVGVSLAAFRECPEGFPRYRKSPSLSATVNKYLDENGLLETPEHSLYGLRHSFEDRMLAAKVDERIRRDLFGHGLDRERYGSGAKLLHLAKVIQEFAL